MIVIIEGLDGTGKSTLIKNLRKEYFKKPRTIVFHSSVPPTVDDQEAWESEHYTTLFDEVVELNYRGFDVILDRAHLGSVVYGSLYRGYESEEIFDIEENFVADLDNQDDVALILLTDSPESGWSRNDGDTIESDLSEYQKTYDKFVNVFSESCIANKLHIDITKNGGFINTLPTVIDFLEKVQK